MTQHRCNCQHGSIMSEHVKDVCEMSSGLMLRSSFTHQ